ncbi:hypothetical protein [Mesoplasma lactucae]|uniref:Uncharacterized protein n=1 Tax=Mesoplasma lactucae ATCC 49193 TaxID=81460 RepID=A0A291IQY4_9MOLU|nr:hypothetical protein [Mesoplasma lactucae]ATG97272.1 hypothetical protein CP520_00670 [Mesoplasma lactucae ATCC 49193]ATZ20278.1 hypothetical protein MLACT_v1c04570 [Mesoplasma lactucae ATCC 49193]MCL8216449.1 hypothetical protein [Mesoplasma lactucae ATCC 49193]
MIKELDKSGLEKLFKDDFVFKRVEPSFQKEMLAQIPTNKELNLDSVNDRRVAIEFLRYVEKKDFAELVKYEDELQLFLVIIAAINNRRNVTQSDLLTLTKIDMPFDNWNETILKDIKQTMFYELYIYMDKNGDIKDEMTNKLENKTLTNEDKKQAKSIADWCNKEVEFLDTTRNQVLAGTQFKNIFMKNEIINFYDQCLDTIKRRLKSQALGFSVASQS